MVRRAILLGDNRKVASSSSSDYDSFSFVLFLTIFAASASTPRFPPAMPLFLQEFFQLRGRAQFPAPLHQRPLNQINQNFPLTSPAPGPAAGNRGYSSYASCGHFGLILDVFAVPSRAVSNITVNGSKTLLTPRRTLAVPSAAWEISI